jgi:hypothetical protein
MTESCSHICTQYVFYTQSLTENRTQTQGKIKGLYFRVCVCIYARARAQTHTHTLLHARRAVGNDLFQPSDTLGLEGNKIPGKRYFYMFW